MNFNCTTTTTYNYQPSQGFAPYKVERDLIPELSITAASPEKALQVYAKKVSKLYGVRITPMSLQTAERCYDYDTELPVGYRLEGTHCYHDSTTNKEMRKRIVLFVKSPEICQVFLDRENTRKRILSEKRHRRVMLRLAEVDRRLDEQEARARAKKNKKEKK